MTGIFTIGYEGASAEDFVETLKLMDIHVLLDIREFPISRRKGFAKNALRQSMESYGIVYHHEARLGSPKPIRDKLKKDKDYSAFFNSYDAYLESQMGLLHSLWKELRGNIALMCYERDHRECHRSSVARELAKITGIQPRHIGVQGHEQREAYKAAGSNSCKGVSTA
ncbi:MAG: DUF488 domain-containing protein [Ectothiorhodospiraceae bacterium]|nr:DUF488 domain-containing protein [Ectothiorhodospiraceae bacterium]